jgi:hypothetical protein
MRLLHYCLKWRWLRWVLDQEENWLEYLRMILDHSHPICFKRRFGKSRSFPW